MNSTSSDEVELTLGHLFYDHHGKMQIAENRNGEIDHVKNVANGLDCKCVCVVCKSNLIAKNNGPKNIHHFSHLKESLDLQCKSAGETALHKIAKKYLSESLTLFVPELKITDGKYQERLSGKDIKFQKAELESTLGQIVPDVIVWLNESKKLLVEFKVTHACDELKIAKIKSLDISAIEIDLSDYRDKPISGLRDPILLQADRIWLHNSKSAQLKKKIGDRKSADEKMVENEAVKLLGSLNTRLNIEQCNVEKYELRLQARQLNEQLVNSKFETTMCFRVRNSEWQSALIERMIEHPDLNYDLNSLYQFLSELDYVSQVCDKLPIEVVKIAKQKNSKFELPKEVIENFLDNSNIINCLMRWDRKHWHLHPSIKLVLEKREFDKAEELERRTKLFDVVYKILSDLPVHETSSFHFETWLDQPISPSNISFKKAMSGPPHQWENLMGRLSAVQSPNWPLPHRDTNYFNLPLNGEHQRQLKKRDQEIAAKQASDKERQASEVFARQSKFETEAVRLLGDSALDFVRSPHSLLNWMSPLVMAAGSEPGYENASRILNIEANIKTAKSVHTHHKDTLFDDIHNYCGKEEYAKLWFKNKNIELDGLRPIEFCETEEKRKNAFDVFVKDWKKHKK